jgi:hypothetical protein
VRIHVQRLGGDFHTLRDFADLHRHVHCASLAGYESDSPLCEGLKSKRVEL